MSYLNWDFLDDTCEIWCINLKYRTDRYAEVVDEFKKINILDKVHFYQPEKMQYGCWYSHQHCMESAYKNNKNLMIFEDDVCFDHISELVFNKIKDMYQNYKWDLFRLGGCIEEIVTIDKDIIFGKFVNLQSVFIHKNYIERCLNNKQFSPTTFKLSTHIDQYYKFDDNIDILLNPQIAWQRASEVDNVWDDAFYYAVFTHPSIYSYNQRVVNWFAINDYLFGIARLFRLLWVIVLILVLSSIKTKWFPKLHHIIPKQFSGD